MVSLLDTTLKQITDRTPAGDGYFNFEYDWLTNKSGNQQFIIEAWDNDSLLSFSPQYKLRIKAIPNVKIIFPENNEQYGLGATIPIQVDASDKDNEVVSVTYYHQNAVGEQK